MGKSEGKARIVRWRGVLDTDDTKLRLMIAAVLALACFSLSFTQLGFVGVDLSGDGIDTYAVVLLQPVALAALLLGTAAGVGIGLVAGLAMYVHANAMPLSYYELTFVTPVTSIVMLMVSGLLLGIMFAFALRNKPSGLKRYAYIAIVCIIVSLMYSLGFMVNVVIAFVTQAFSDMGIDPTQEQISAFESEMTLKGMRFGSVRYQAEFDSILMIALSFVGDAAARKAMQVKGNMGLRGQFAVWLSVVVLIAFMITSVWGFVAVTIGEVSQASRVLKSKVNYVCMQLSESDRQIESVANMMDSLDVNLDNLSDSELDEFLNFITVDTLLEGYTLKEDGLIMITKRYTDPENEIFEYVCMHDDDRQEADVDIKQLLTDDAIKAVDESIASGKVVRTIYDSAGRTTADAKDMGSHVASTSIAYLYSQKVTPSVQESGYYVVTALMPSDMVFANRDTALWWTMLSIVVLLIAVYVLTFRLLSVLVVRRIDETNGMLARIGTGDLDARVDVRDTREFKSLSAGINDTVSALKGWIAEAETRMDAELATAKAIQEAALPRVFPPYPDIARFDVYATMNAAREVGGDFYDFFLVGDDSCQTSGKLAFIIADVSGKGVPAALFMMKAKTQIRDYLASGMEIGEAIENANHQLCDGNDAGMFVTVWAGVLDYATGHVDFVNAGHNPPLLWQGASWSWLVQKSGMPLGLFDGMPYKAHAVECRIGDQFLLYTDGVTEAMDVEGNLYGEERLEKIANANFALHPRDLVEAVRSSVKEHAEGAVQSDDITLLALEVGVPPEITSTLRVAARTTELPRINEFIHGELERRLCPLRAQAQLDIAVEEMFVNVARYAYPDATPDNPGSVYINCTITVEPPSITVSIIDDGVPFDPLAKPDAVTPDDIMDVPIGGLGILMSKKSVDEMSYERVDGSNVLTLVKKW